MTETGHRFSPHTAEHGFEVWAPTRDQCYAEAVRALVASFASVPSRAQAREVRVELAPACEEDMLADLLEEVLEVVDDRDLVPVDVAVEDTADGGLVAEMIVVPGDTVELVGDLPQSVAVDGLSFRHESDHWVCRFLVED